MTFTANRNTESILQAGFLTPYYHRDCMAEFEGLIHGRYGPISWRKRYLNHKRIF